MAGRTAEHRLELGLVGPEITDECLLLLCVAAALEDGLPAGDHHPESGHGGAGHEGPGTTPGSGFGGLLDIFCKGACVLCYF